MDARDQNGRHQEHGELNVKITAVRAHALTMPVEQPLWTAQEALKDSSLVLVEIDAGAGLTGYGIIHGSPLKRIAEWVTRFGELIRGDDALAHEIIWNKLFALTVPRPRAMYGTDGLVAPLPRSARPNVMAAIGGIDIALWDLKAKAARMPVYKLLGGEQRPIFTYSKLQIFIFLHFKKSNSHFHISTSTH